MLSSHPDLQRQIITSSLGAWATMYFSAIDQRGDPDVNILMDAMAAGLGARSFADGVNTGGIIHAPAGQIPNVEQNELFHPVLYLYRREETDSGGAGKFRGGAGASLCVVPHDTDRAIDWQWFSYGQAFPTSVGVCGGWPTRCTEATIIRGAGVRDWFERGEIPVSIEEVGGERIDFLPKGSYRQDGNDLFHCYWQGGSGFGDPLERDPERVAEDVLNGYVSVDAARNIYGVSVDPETMRLDEQGTEEQRRKIREARGATEPARMPGTDAPDEIRLDEHLLLDARGNVICSRCGHTFGHQSENYKLSAVEKTQDFREVGLLKRDLHELIDREVAFRRYFCPSCGTNLENEVILSDAAPIHDKRLNLDGVS
jgi:N-methylhydantoinase B